MSEAQEKRSPLELANLLASWLEDDLNDHYLQPLIQAFAALEARVRECEWISVSERYPKLGQQVLVWFAGEAEPHMDLWTYSGENQYFMAKTRAKNSERVTHWQPLPEPPRVSGQAGE
jgi:hypothetical protein